MAVIKRDNLGGSRDFWEPYCTQLHNEDTVVSKGKDWLLRCPATTVVVFHGIRTKREVRQHFNAIWLKTVRQLVEQTDSLLCLLH